MSRNVRFILALQLTEAERFREIFGEVVAQLAREDIARGLDRLCASLLGRYQRYGEVITPRFGLWYLFFGPKASIMTVDMEEQFAVLRKVGESKVRDLFRDSFGTATGSRQKFRLSIGGAPEAFDSQAIEAAIDEASGATAHWDVSQWDGQRDALRQIIAAGGGETYFQPIVSLADGKLVGYEALTRGPPVSALHDADLLFAAARHCGLAETLELICLQRALSWLPKIPEPLWIAVNLGPDLFIAEKFRSYLAKVSQQIPFSRVVFELTEHLPVASAAHIRRVADGFNKSGMRLSLDDTGCGFFDLTTVNELRPEIVKLCITVVSRIGRCADVEREIRRTIEEVARLGGCILGEGVETPQQAEVLKQCGAVFAQGNYFGVPKPAASLFGD